MTCRLCGAKDFEIEIENVLDFEYSSPGVYHYNRCKECGLLMVAPFPKGEQLDAAYPDSYHAYHFHHSRVSKFLKNRFWKEKAKRYSQLIPKAAKILELGCSFGNFLLEFKRLGYPDPKGLEYNGKIAKKAQDSGLTVVQGEIQSANFPKNEFNLIIMENFIEHVEDPYETFRWCHSHLSEGGILAGETPNINSWDKKLFGNYWGGYHCPRHLFLFDIENLSYISKKSGFRVIRISNLLQPAHWALSVQNLFQGSGLRTPLKNGRSFYFLGLLLLAIPLNFIQKRISNTSSVEFIFQKI
jgi:SAM-dependent methyltransferase